MKKLLLSMAIALGFSAVAHAQTNVPSKLPAPIQLAVQAGMKVENKFDAAGGLTGWILSQGIGKYQVAFTPANGEVVLAGIMRGANGEDLTKQYLDQYAPKPNYEKFWSQLDKAATINEGAQGAAVKSTIYAFLDPNCIYCHYAHKAFSAYHKAGLQVKWVPVAILGGDSAGKAAAIMTSKNPGAALAEHERTWDPRNGKPGIAPLENIPAKVKTALDANSRLMVEMGFRGTPAIIYKDANGKVLTADGMPSLNELPGITGLPEQAITDAELQRFRR